ncbi:hypothetical protein E2C01_077050 [Portunus trituberculatus]|uniref:Uncharacterized protein n=1 Tax=Portunus trituberculatus TaxID=210409 RepID=A0A5B7IJ83_PORTR|nr:hypothetical protein [Portunus trituberculatus]
MPSRSQGHQPLPVPPSLVAPCCVVVVVFQALPPSRPVWPVRSWITLSSCPLPLSSPTLPPHPASLAPSIHVWLRRKLGPRGWLPCVRPSLRGVIFTIIYTYLSVGWYSFPNTCQEDA